MQRLTFKLEAVRTLREQVEQQAQQALAHQLTLEGQRLAALDLAGERLAEARRLGTAPPGGVTSAAELVARQRYVERAERDQRAARANLAAQRRQVDAERGRLEQASRDRKVLDQLKERALTAHRARVARAEEELLSEIAIAGHQRRAALEAA
jgi:flagellar export protein FliJ